jgi:hypothetical protein
MPLSFDDIEESRPVECTAMIPSDETHHDSGPHVRRKGTVLTPTEEPTTQNVSSQGPPNMIGIITKLKMNAAKNKAKVHKMPAMDRNLESLNSEELTGYQSPSQMR